MFVFKRVREIRNKLIHTLIIINLILLSFVLIGRIRFIKNFAVTSLKALVIPIIISLFLFYIVRPLNNIFIKKGLGYGKASLLTLCIGIFILGGGLSCCGRFAYEQFQPLSKRLVTIINNKAQVDGIISYLNQFISSNELYSLAADMVRNYIMLIGRSFMRFAGYFMNTFSMVFLIIVVVFYMLKDGHKFKNGVLHFVPERYKDNADKMLSESDVIISHYVTGQAKVALSLAVMTFIGYKIIGMPNALLLSAITFILAFIPFVGFFISMIIPLVISLGIGLYMFIKLAVVFIIAQTLKGRVIVPAVMSKSMNIHPLTDIFLVIGAIAIGGPFAAFIVVPVYAIIKNAVKIIRCVGADPK